MGLCKMIASGHWEPIWWPDMGENIFYEEEAATPIELTLNRSPILIYSEPVPALLNASENDLLQEADPRHRGYFTDRYQPELGPVSRGNMDFLEKILSPGEFSRLKVLFAFGERIGPGGYPPDFPQELWHVDGNRNGEHNLKDHILIVKGEPLTHFIGLRNLRLRLKVFRLDLHDILGPRIRREDRYPAPPCRVIRFDSFHPHTPTANPLDHEVIRYIFRAEIPRTLPGGPSFN